MLTLAKSTLRAPRDYSACSGCNLCLLVCPVWRRTHDFSMTPHGRAKALQFGADASDIAASVQSCTLCAACEPVCPEEIPLVAMTLDLRRQLPRPAAMADLLAAMEKPGSPSAAMAVPSATVLLPGTALRDRPSTLARVRALLQESGAAAIGADDGADIALALEAGAAIPQRRLDRFLRPLHGVKKIVVADGLLLRHMQPLLPGSKIIGVGEALSGLAAVRSALRANDLYVIEARAYHADYQRLVRYYDSLRAAAGCAFNLDLQRIAIPATARSLPQRLGLDAIDDGVQLRWILQGRKVTRIVVESMEDRAAFQGVSALPVVHLADLADDGTSSV
ncbi:MAG: 4Fe-4S dicluster domain-containing protein [Burkholderiales bacterium]|nr:4Fe-4S dicluster domain-containing protein [Burkholderiales bacterium]